MARQDKWRAKRSAPPRDQHRQAELSREEVARTQSRPAGPRVGSVAFANDAHRALETICLLKPTRAPVCAPPEREPQSNQARDGAYFFFVDGGLVNENVAGATGVFFGCLGFRVSRLLRFCALAIMSSFQ